MTYSIGVTLCSFLGNSKVIQLYTELAKTFVCIFLWNLFGQPHTHIWCWFSHYIVSNSCDPHGSSLGSSVHGIFQARILEWFPSPGIFPTQGLNPHVLHLLHCRQILYLWVITEAFSDYFPLRFIIGYWICNMTKHISESKEVDLASSFWGGQTVESHVGRMLLNK